MSRLAWLVVLASFGCAAEEPRTPAWTPTGGAATSGVDLDTDGDDDDDVDDDDDGDPGDASTTGTDAPQEPDTDPTGGDEPEGDPAVPAGTCGPGEPTGELVQVSLGTDRYYYVGVPPADGPLPMVVAFHGDEGHPDEAVRWFWRPVWEAEQSFILVMMKCPGCTSWYTGDTNAKADYVWEVLGDVATKYDVDVSRIYAIGYSGGSSFLALHGLEFQDVFAGIQWHCGGGWTDYIAPPRTECAVDGRFVISTDDFLWDNAKAMEQLLVDNDHEVEFVQAQCSGHCCHTDDLAQGAWAWFQQRTKCDGIVTGTCAELRDLP